MTSKEKKEALEQRRIANAVAFLSSVRGKYIMGQALHYGIKALEAVEPEVMQERSNIADMKFLMDELFTLGHVFTSTELFTNAELFTSAELFTIEPPEVDAKREDSAGRFEPTTAPKEELDQYR